MELLKKLFTALRGHGRAALESAVDSQSLRILEQEIHDWERAIWQAKGGLKQIVAERLRLTRELDISTHHMLRVEERTVELLKADEAQRARALAEQIAQEEELIERLRDQLGKIQSREQQLRGRIHLALQAARHSRNELRLARSNEEAMRATAQLQPALGRQLDEMPAEVQSTLQRIRERQQSRQDESDAGSIIYAEFTRDTLASGKSRVGRTDAVLHRLRQLHLSPNA